MKHFSVYELIECFNGVSHGLFLTHEDIEVYLSGYALTGLAYNGQKPEGAVQYYMRGNVEIAKAVPKAVFSRHI